MARPRKDAHGPPEQILDRYIRIVEAFKFAGLGTTQAEIGAALRPPVTQGGVSHWKMSNPSVDYLCQIVDLTGVSGHWLLMGSGSKANADQLIQGLIDRLDEPARDQLLARVQGKK